MKGGSGTSYGKGYRVEREARGKLRQLGAVVFRSAGSHGIADLVALNPQLREVWLVQVKKAEAPKRESTLKRRFKALKELEGTYRVKACVYMKREGKYRFIEI
jgi:Holliday junction resolvase